MEPKKEVQIAAKLNPEYDADLIEAIEKIPRRDRSRTFREAFRFYLNHKEMEDKK